MVQVPGIPGYKILSELGEGGMAKVYLGLQEKLKRKVAIKILDPGLLTNKKTAERFSHEAEIAANLQHSNIIQIFDTGKIDDYHYIVMEYLGESLKDRMVLFPGNQMPPGTALDIIDKMMGALDYAHWRGVFHRDIKPDNIMFRQDSTPVLMDFGIALLFDLQDKSPRITREGLILGTVDYMSPEQCRNEKEIDGRSDTYSLGVVLYEMLVGRTPYEGDSQMHIAFKHTQEPVPRLPGELSRYQPLIEGMMAKDRGKRISSGAQFLRLLDYINRGMVGTVSSPGELTLDEPLEIPLAEPTPQVEMASAAGETTAAEVAEVPGVPEAPELLEIPELPELPEVPVVKGVPYFVIEKPVGGLNLLLTGFVDFLREGLRPFLRRKTRDLGTFKDHTLEKMDPVMEKPIMKKLFLWILPGLVVLVFLAIILLNSGPGRPEQRRENSPSLLFEIIQQAPQYYRDLKLAREYFQAGDYKSLEQARRLLGKLKRIVVIPEVEGLEMMIRNRLSQLQRDFNRYYDEAIDYYYKERNLDKALESLQKAKEIYANKELLELEQRIEEEQGAK
jgi:serine/threonine protein kinase